ncbi:hypothetical protein RWE15_13480 [Virgibacillus halophilus]|uniref:Uncharacterized protein n=1 Tax=Tigheibacillus halophilus TaxID=361280 RepID=A0ABU5C887_9BACI|nr:hypothetical protein [Virgibacillus halophilus]
MDWSDANCTPESMEDRYLLKKNKENHFVLGRGNGNDHLFAAVLNVVRLKTRLQK